jgi:hypothetical protein
MANLNKLDEIIQGLENQVADIKNFSGALIEINELMIRTSSFSEVILIHDKKLTDLTERFSSIIQGNEKNFSLLKERTEYSFNQFQENIDQKINAIDQNNKSFQKEFDHEFNIQIENIASNYRQLSKNLDEKVDLIYQGNKSFQREIDSTFNIKLEKIKIELQTERRNESLHLMREIESFSGKKMEQINMMQVELKENIQNATKKTNIMFSISTLVLALLCVFHYFYFLKN